MAGFEDMVQRISARFYREVYCPPTPIKLPPGKHSGYLAELARQSGLVARAAYGLHNPSDHDNIDTILVDSFHPTSSREGLVTQLDIKEIQLAQEGIHLDRSSLLELVKDDPYASCYARFFDHLVGHGILDSKDDVLLLEGFEGKTCALARYPGLKNLGTALALTRGQRPYFEVQGHPFLREIFSHIVSPKVSLPRTSTGIELASALDEAHRIIFPTEPLPTDSIQGGIPQYNLRGVDGDMPYRSLSEALSAGAAKLTIETLAAQRALGIIADIGTVVKGQRNVFALYGKFDIMAWEEPADVSGKNSIEQHLPERRCLVFSPQRVYTGTELDDRFMSQARARQAEAQLKHP